MSFSKIRHNSGSIIFKIKVENDDGSTIENWTIMQDDFDRVFKILQGKYGDKAQNKKDNRDLDWIN